MQLLIKGFVLLALMLGHVFPAGNWWQSPAAPPTQTAPAAQSSIVSGYYASWAAYSGVTPDQIPAAKITHLHYAFAKIGENLNIEMGDPYIDPTNFQALAELKRANPTLKTLISVGGWSDSDGFSDAALTADSRAVFADSVVAFLRQYGFDGVDLDWEYPVGGGLSDNVTRPEDKQNFTLLLGLLREKLDAASKADGRDYLLTIAGGAGDFYIANTQLKLIGDLVDYAVLMTYDFHGGWDSYTDLNAPLYTPSEGSPQYQSSADQAVENWTAAGFPVGKLLLGVPFYGHLYQGVSGGGNGLYQTYSYLSSVAYDDIVSRYLSNQAFVRTVHADAHVPWLFDGSTFLSYDDAASLKEKAAYTASRGLAGVAVWEVSQNTDGTLLDALAAGLNGT